MNKLFTAFALSILTAVSAFGQGLVRYSPTTNGAVAIGTLANNQVLTWMNPPGIWTNRAVVATATNAIADMSGLGTNTAFHGPITFSGSISNNGAFTNAGPVRFLAGVTNLGAFTNAGNVYLGSQLYVQGSSTLVGNVGAQGDLVQTGSGVAQLLATTVTGEFTNNGNAGFGGNVYIQSGLTNGGALSNVSHVYVGGSAVIHGGLTNLGVTRLVGTVTNLGDVGIGGNAVITGQIDGGDTATFRSDVNMTAGPLTLGSLTVSTVLYGDGSKNITSIANGTGMLTNNGSGTVGWMAIPGGTASTNNAVMANNYEAVGSIEVTNNFINYWHAGVPGPVATTNWLYATNGDSQYYNLFSGTNIQYVPLAGAYASNHLGVAVAFTQNSTGGYYPTNNGQLIPVRTNANASTMVYFSIANGATNVTVAYPFSMGPLPNNPNFPSEIIEWNNISKTWTNGTVTGTGDVVRGAGPTITRAIITSSSTAAHTNESTMLEKVGTVAGTGGANTNFTLLAYSDESVIYVDAGTTNVNILAIMNYSSTHVSRGTLILTNRTGTARTFSLGAITNNWISLQQFDGIQAPFTVTNSQAGRFDYEILGTNVQYSYKPMALPSN